jgi:hypothetical protein
MLKFVGRFLSIIRNKELGHKPFLSVIKCKSPTTRYMDIVLKSRYYKTFLGNYPQCSPNLNITAENNSSAVHCPQTLNKTKNFTLFLPL